MNEKTLRLLEFDLIRRGAAARALSAEAEELILNEEPLIEAEMVEELKSQVGALMIRFAAGDGGAGKSLPSIAPLFPKLETGGAVLELDEALALGLFIERAGEFIAWLRGDSSLDQAGGLGALGPQRGALRGAEPPAGGAAEGPAGAQPRGDRSEGGAPPFTVTGNSGSLSLRALAAEIPDCSALGREIFRIIDRDGKLRDLPEFREIKRRIESLIRDLESAGSRYTGNEETRRMLQSTVPSQRDGRMVLAVKANFRGRVRGIVHEVSSTGQTVFVEPEEVVEKNNELLLERRALDAEIRRVLRGLTGRIGADLETLRDFHRRFLRLETIRARARYGIESRGIFALSAGNALVLKQARHPLLASSRAVPLDLVMENGIRTVIITGPNTGGKTVALKTAGLLALMNQFGLPVPAAEGTEIPVFDGIYADIGDEQSISQSLSTFSAHMTNIAGIAGRAGSCSLVLLDELGSGTDPEEGSAIAMAILDHLLEKKARLIITTHHGILKNYGYTREGVENASMEFDGLTLSPTYRVVMGIPGESRALDIAGKNGLDPAIVEKARSYLADERSDISALIRGLKEKHRELDAEARAREAETRKLREDRRGVDLKELRLRQRELALKRDGAAQFRLLLGESRKTLENLVRELKEGELSREKTLKVKEFLRDLEEKAAAEAAVLEEEEASLSVECRRLEAEDAGQGPRREGKIPVLEAGTEVLIGEQRRRGRIIRADKKAGSRSSWIVEIGSLKMSFPETELTPVLPSLGEKKPLISSPDLAFSSPARFEINLRGMRLDEALEALRVQIDAALLSGLREFAVIHGKGDGVLQKGVHDYLRGEDTVADYYFSRPELGGFGRTEVILK